MKAKQNAGNRKTRTQPTRASQRARAKGASENNSNNNNGKKKKTAAPEPVNTTDEFEKPKAKKLKKSNSKTNVSVIWGVVRPLVRDAFLKLYKIDCGRDLLFKLYVAQFEKQTNRKML